MNTKNLYDLNKVYNHFIGADYLMNELERMGSAKTTNFPPYNIKRCNSRYVIELAVAGYSKDEIDITVERNVLRISSVTPDNQKDKTVSDKEWSFVYNGIAQRSFRREFTLAENMKVQGADYENGILSIFLEKVIPEEHRPKSIPIGYKTDPVLLVEKTSNDANYESRIAA